MIIKQSDNIKYLGVIIDDKLNFKKHISKIKQKLYPSITNLWRNRKYINCSIAATWYKSIIRPNLEYCASLLLSNHNYIKNDLLKIENRCLKIIDPLSHKIDTRYIFNIPSLTIRLQYLYLLSFFKINFKLVKSIDNELLPKRSLNFTRLSTDTGFLLGKDKAKFLINNFGAKLFNDLPPHVRNKNDLKSFKSSLRIYLIYSSFYSSS